MNAKLLPTQEHPEPPDSPVLNPGLPPHHWRPTDVDPKAEKRAERQVAFLFTLSMVLVVLFCIAFYTFKVGENPDTFTFGGTKLGTSTVVLGVLLGGVFLCIGVGIIQWARKLMGDQEIVEMRHSAHSSPEDRQHVLDQLSLGLEESGLARRPLIRNTLLGALGLVGVPAIVALSDLGPLPGNKLYTTIWTKGMRVVRDVVGTPIHVSDLEIGDLVNAEPEAIFPTEENGYEELSAVDLQIAKSKAAVILHRMDPKEITPSAGRENWSVQGIVCYSKICTHVGCPISLLEQQTHNLLCPCHQSTFDLADNGRVLFGPAARPLPQLPLAVDSEGYLIAQGPFTEPVGPSFWERD